VAVEEDGGLLVAPHWCLFVVDFHGDRLLGASIAIGCVLQGPVEVLFVGGVEVRVVLASHHGEVIVPPLSQLLLLLAASALQVHTPLALLGGLRRLRPHKGACLQ